MKQNKHQFIMIPIVILLIFGVSMPSFGFEKPAIKGKGSIPSSINKAKSKSVSPKDLKGKSIKIVKGTCCKNGELMTGKLTKTECEKKNRGTFYLSSSTAKKYCGFCCTKSGKVTSIEDSGDKGSCSKGGGTFYNTESRAESNCGWCLLKGKIFKVTDKKKECLGKGGAFYETETAAKKKLKENKGFCNVDGNTLLGLSAKECNKKKGKFFKIQGLARVDLQKFKKKNGKKHQGIDKKKKGRKAVDGKIGKLQLDPEMIPLERVAPPSIPAERFVLRPDLEVVSMWSEDANGERSRNHHVMVEIRNNGEAVSQETAVRLHNRFTTEGFEDGPNFNVTANLPGALRKGETVFLSIPVGHWSHSVNGTFKVDYDNDIRESNESNNIISTELGPRTGQPDLRVTSINYNEMSIGAGLSVGCNIRNYGANITDSQFRNMKVRATLAGQSEEISVKLNSSNTLLNLNGAANFYVSFNDVRFEFDGRSTPLTIFVDSTGVVDESNEENNTETVDVGRAYRGGKSSKIITDPEMVPLRRKAPESRPAKRPVLRSDLEVVSMRYEQAGSDAEIVALLRNNGPIGISETILDQIMVVAEYPEETDVLGYAEIYTDFPRNLLKAGETATVHFPLSAPFTESRSCTVKVDVGWVVAETNENNNVLTKPLGPGTAKKKGTKKIGNKLGKLLLDPEMIPLKRVAPASLPAERLKSLLDLEVVSMWSADANGERSVNHHVVVELRNNGEGISRETAVRMRSRLSNPAFNEPVYYNFIGPILKGSTRLLKLPVGPWNRSVSNCKFTVDLDNIVPEYNERNNVFSTSLGPGTGQPDLRVVSTYVNGASTACTIQNFGTSISESQFDNLKVRATLGGQSKEIFVKPNTTLPLVKLNKRGYRMRVTFEDSLFEYDGRTTPLIFFIDSTGVIDESNEENNTKSRDVSQSFSSGDRGIQKPAPGGLIPGRFQKEDRPARMSAQGLIPDSEPPSDGVLKRLPMPSIQIRTPNERSFYTPDSPLAVVAEWLDSSLSGPPPAGLIELRNRDGVAVFSQGNVAIPVMPASGNQNIVHLNIPTTTAAGEYQIYWEAVEQWGESEWFNISHLGHDDEGMTISLPVADQTVASSSLRVVWQGWGDDCNSDDEYTIWLFKGSATGRDHLHWQLHSGRSEEERTVTLPPEAENGDDYFIRIDIGPSCDGTTGMFTIAR